MPATTGRRLGVAEHAQRHRVEESSPSRSGPCTARVLAEGGAQLRQRLLPAAGVLGRQRHQARQDLLRRS